MKKIKNISVEDQLLLGGWSDLDETRWANHVWAKERPELLRFFPAFSREKIRYIGDCALRLQLHQGVDIVLRGIIKEIFVGPYN